MVPAELQVDIDQKKLGECKIRKVAERWLNWFQQNGYRT
jgi:hypothetical protein